MAWLGRRSGGPWSVHQCFELRGKLRNDCAYLLSIRNWWHSSIGRACYQDLSCRSTSRTAQFHCATLRLADRREMQRQPQIEWFKYRGSKY